MMRKVYKITDNKEELIKSHKIKQNDDGSFETDVENKVDRIRYSFSNGLKGYLEEMTVEQQDRIMKLFKPLVNDTSKRKLTSQLSLNMDSHYIVNIMKICFITDESMPTTKKESLIKSLKSSEAEIVLKDFFFLNPRAMHILKTFVVVAALDMEMNMLKNIDNTAKITSQNS